MIREIRAIPTVVAIRAGKRPSHFRSLEISRYKCRFLVLPKAESRTPEADLMTHAQLVEKAVRWLRSYRCGVVLSEQACVSGEMPDAIGWKRANHSVLVECKVTRADFLADRGKPFRQKPEQGVGCERFYLTPPALVKTEELPSGLGTARITPRKNRGNSELGKESANRCGLPL